MNTMKLEKLYNIIKKRRIEKSNESYVASLTGDRIIQKVGEEAVEVVIAAKNSDNDKLILESTDLLFHLLVLLETRGIFLDDIYTELQKRNRR